MSVFQKPENLEDNKPKVRKNYLMKTHQEKLQRKYFNLFLCTVFCHPQISILNVTNIC